MADVFISYARADRSVAEQLAGILRGVGWSVWWDRNIQVGRAFSDVIEHELEVARCVLVLWSAASIQSDWVLTEASEGAARKVLVPVQIDDVKLPLEFRRLHTAKLIGWRGEKDHPEILNCISAVRSLIGSTDSDTTGFAHASTPLRTDSRQHTPIESEITGLAETPPVTLPRRSARTLVTLVAVMLIIAWLAGVGLHVGGGLIHIFLIIAIVIVLVQFATGRGRRAADSGS